MSSKAGGSGQFWFLTVAAGIALALVAVNIVLARKNQSLQTEINNRQQFINQTIQVSRLNTQVIQGLANLSASTGDQQIKDLLAANGISFTANAPPVDEEAAKAEQDEEKPE